MGERFVETMGVFAVPTTFAHGLRRARDRRHLLRDAILPTYDWLDRD